MAQKLNYDYARACQLVADATDNDMIESLLLRFSASLASGEPEVTFLARETEVQLETYARKYERDLETLQKWTDSFVALMVSVTLIVVVSMVSMMIYSVGTLFILGTGRRHDRNFDDRWLDHLPDLAGRTEDA